ncbi:MAG: hypothetical protein WBE36_10530, partial [Terracidiphilus sp.]
RGRLHFGRRDLKGTGFSLYIWRLKQRGLLSAIMARSGRKSARNSLHFDGLTPSICKTSPFFYFTRIFAFGPGKTRLRADGLARNTAQFTAL